MFTSCKPQSRHLRVLKMSAELVLECLLGPREKVKIEGLPDGVRVQAVCWDDMHCCFLFRLEHESFSKVEPCSVLPELEVRVSRVEEPALMELDIALFADQGNAVPKSALSIPGNPFYGTWKG